ncbi:MAG: RNA polymerase sigma factor [Pirellulaceae bacterium]
MSEHNSEFRQALECACSGSQEDFCELIERFGPHIKMVVRKKLHHRMRSKFDTVDFVQMVWASFFADSERRKRINDPDELLRYLVKMAANKVIEESRRRLKYQKHNVNRELPLRNAEAIGASSRKRSDTPSQIAIARERYAHIIRNRSERDRRIVEMRMHGVTFDEISKKLGIHERTARHVIAKLDKAGAGVGKGAS